MLIYENYISSTRTAVRTDMPYTISVLVSVDERPAADVSEDMPAIAAAVMYALAALGLADAFGGIVSYETYVDEFEHAVHEPFRRQVLAMSVRFRVPEDSGYRLADRLSTFFYAVLTCVDSMRTQVCGVYLDNERMDHDSPGIYQNAGLQLYDNRMCKFEFTGTQERRAALWKSVLSGDVEFANELYYMTLTDKKKREMFVEIIGDDELNSMSWGFSESWDSYVEVISGESSDTDIYYLSMNSRRDYSECYNTDVRQVKTGFYPVVIKINEYDDGTPDMIDACFWYMECTPECEIAIYAPRMFTAHVDEPFDTETAVNTMMGLTGQPREYCVKFISEIVTHYYGNDYADFG